MYSVAVNGMHQALSYMSTVQVKSLPSWQSHIVSGSERAARKLVTQLLSAGGDAKPFCCKKIKGEGDEVIMEIDAAATSDQLQSAVIAEIKTCLTSDVVGQLCQTISRIMWVGCVDSICSDAAAAAVITPVSVTA